jgi:anti-anti-sigma factor
MRPLIGDWFRVELNSDESCCTLILSGALRGTSIAALEAQVDQLGATCCDQVVVDVSGLTEVDSVGASVLIGLSHYVTARGGELRIVGATGLVGSTLHASTLPPPRQCATSDVDTPGGMRMSNDERSWVSAATRAAETDEASARHAADRPPTQEEEEAIEGETVDPDVAEHFEDMAERGADERGEGRIP